MSVACCRNYDASCAQLEASCEDHQPSSRYRNTKLFNCVTVLLVTAWVGIVAVAIELAGAKPVVAMPSLQSFLAGLL